jgi:hypothetical protein
MTSPSYVGEIYFVVWVFYEAKWKESVDHNVRQNCVGVRKLKWFGKIIAEIDFAIDDTEGYGTERCDRS